ncbi:MAG: polysaccharide biosynthesis tyrosine autokinase [Chloroflexota bacterium]
MELRTYLQIINRRKWIILTSTLVAAFIASAVMYVAAPIYVATTTLRVATIGSESGGRIDINYTERLMNTYSQIVRSGNVRRQLRTELALTELPSLAVEKIVNTELMRIQVEAKDPNLASTTANKAAEILIAKSLELYGGGGRPRVEILNEQFTQAQDELAQVREEYDLLLKSSDGTTSRQIDSLGQSIAVKERTVLTLLEQYESARIEESLRTNAVSIIEHAIVPSSAAKPRKELNIILGTLLGLFSGLALALVLENLDTTLYSAHQIEALTNQATVGRIPAKPGGTLELVQYGDRNYPQLEAFRRLRINVLAATSDLPSTSLLVTSAEEKEGKSTVTANLAVTIAQSGRRVVVVDCNLHNPQLHTLFSVPNTKGLSDILTKDVDIDDMLLTTQYPRLSIVPSGTQISSSMVLVGSLSVQERDLFSQLTQGTELLGSSKMRETIAQLREVADVILLDTPALRSVTDAAMLVPLVDNVLLVVARSHSSRESLQSTYKQLETVHAKMISLVVNQE